MPGFKPYLGLAMPYPEEIPEWKVDIDKKLIVRNGFYAARLIIDDKGRVREVPYHADSALYFEPLDKKKKDIRFRFLEGRKFEFPLTIPVLLEYSSFSLNIKLVRLHFPVSAETPSDTTLLAEFFALNGVYLPALKDMLPVSYYFDRGRDEPLCLTISAMVTLDKEGQLTALEYPLEGQDQMTHQIHSSLIRAEFEPARIGQESIASEFFLTFRIFDNLRFPFSPFMPVDTTRDRLFTEDYFMIRYLNPGDISIFALPQKYGSGKIPMPREFRQKREELNFRLGISQNGKARVLSMVNSPRQHTAPEEIARVTSWYPAVNNAGYKISFSGIVKVKLDGGAHIVCIPEWLGQ
ncbi:MAG: hypothetical protein GY841_07460 [FCB group bacterium]|nr:hypothetical protein [FCB group bacterium]